MRIGILGGTFDPIHIGHLALAEVARVRLGLDKVLFVVAGNPYFKKDRCITETLHRVKMVRLAIQGNPYFDLSTLEVERPGPSYAAELVSMCHLIAIPRVGCPMPAPERAVERRSLQPIS